LNHIYKVVISATVRIKVRIRFIFCICYVSTSDVVKTVTSETERKLRDRDFAKKAETENWKFETETSHLSDGNQSQLLEKCCKNIWNVAKYQYKGACHCFASINLFYSEKCVDCLVR